MIGLFTLVIKSDRLNQLYCISLDFISPKQDESKYTYGRMWKITKEQFTDVWDQEGRSWYDEKIELGQDENNIPIYTITSSSESELNKPSDKYLKTIIDGLKETFHLDDKSILKYLIEKPGIKNNWKEEEIVSLFH